MERRLGMKFVIFLLFLFNAYNTYEILEVSEIQPTWYKVVLILTFLMNITLAVGAICCNC